MNPLARDRFGSEIIAAKPFDQRVSVRPSRDMVHVSTSFEASSGCSIPPLGGGAKPKSDVPESGDFVWLNFTPQAGHGQACYRPVLVISPSGYNGKTGLMVCGRMTNQIRSCPFEIAITRDEPSVAPVDQVKNLN